jgi:hypothetical protein
MSRAFSHPAAAYVALAVASASMLVLAACGGNSGTSEKPAVASVPRSPGNTPGSTPAVDPEDARPLVREDTSDEEFVRLYNAWSSCLRDHGMPAMTDGKGQIKQLDDGSSKYAPARKACVAKQPEYAKDRLARQHPAEYLDLFREAISCAKSKGWTAAAPDPHDPTQPNMMADPSLPIGKKMDIWGACEEKIFAKKN